MAEIGKGDPRWIVKDREDGANCNNWHWTEKDILGWAKTQISEIIEGNYFEKTSSMEVKTTEVQNIEGDALIMNRKKKLICSFDLKMEIGWEGKLIDPDTGDEIYTVKGKMIVPDVDDTTIGDDMTVEITCAEDGDAADKVLKVVRKQGRTFVRKGMEEFADSLKDAHNITNKVQSKVHEGSPKAASSSNDKKTVNTDLTDTLSARYDWRCPPSELWDALTNQGKASAYTRSNALIDLKPGGEFKYLGGSISGTFTSVDAPKGFVMKWRLDNWNANHYSEVSISLDSQESGVTEMKIEQVNIPCVCFFSFFFFVVPTYSRREEPNQIESRYFLWPCADRILSAFKRSEKLFLKKNKKKKKTG